MRFFLTTLAIFILGVLAIGELALAFLVPWWLYTLPVVAFALTQLRAIPLRQQLPQLLSFAVILAIVGILYFVDWTTRKPFLRALDRIEVGMSEQEVREIMRGYIEGTGWPANPGAAPTIRPAEVQVPPGAIYQAEGSVNGELVLRDSLVFRHSNDGRFNSDWGIVKFTNGSVAAVQFSPD